MKEVLIIGGGVAGLSAGICAQLSGFHATVCEQHAIAGGCLTAWERGGYHIDNCIHWLTGTNPHTDLYELWRDLGVLTGADGEIYRRPALYTFVNGKGRMALDRDIDALYASMLSLSPDDGKEITAFIKAVKALQGVLGIAGKDHDEEIPLGQLVSSVPNLIKYYRLSLSELSRCFKHPTLRHFFMSFLPENFGVLGLLYVIANYCGDSADLPYGGSEQMAQRLIGRFTSLGGTLLTGKKAARLNTERRRAVSVTFADGDILFADSFILTIDPARIFGALTDVKMPQMLRERYRKLRRFSAYHCAFGVESEQLPFDGDVTLYIPVEYQKKMHAKYLLVRNDSHEQGYAPERKSLLQVMVYCGEKTSRALIRARAKDREKYTAFKNDTAAIIEELLIKQYPALSGRLTMLDTWTPASYRRYVGSQIGSFMSFVLPSKYLPREQGNEIRGLDNVRLAGQWLQPPGGLPIAALSGKHAVESLR